MKDYFQLYHNQLMTKVLTNRERENKRIFKGSIIVTSSGSVTSSVNCAGGVGANKRSIITFCFMRRVEIYA